MEKFKAKNKTPTHNKESEQHADLIDRLRTDIGHQPIAN